MADYLKTADYRNYCHDGLLLAFTSASGSPPLEESCTGLLLAFTSASGSPSLEESCTSVYAY